uniref:30S ribosomal protein 3, chloroplastic n=2 Tax=Heterosigma akashiwo TaxID=2829 RepID=B2XT48_HETAK|nr:putative ribosomal protein 3 [Heterosigma akashiwo]ABV65946.1 30S ribosomal plastid-specific protein 3 [Heterosigma akashiwo]ABV70087.1 30S ribosomal plastid-specific protein 3 [Heterosigma akashiwo]
MSKFYFKVVWLKYCIGISVDKKLKNSYRVPITSFYFWPRVDGWKLLKHELELKPWLSERERVTILNGYTRIISIWKDCLEQVDYFDINSFEKDLNFTLVAID